MSRLGIVVALLLISIAPAGAGQQGDSQKQEQVQQKVQEIKERLKLTPEQAEQMLGVLKEEAQKFKAVREKYGEGTQSRRSRIKMARELREIQQEGDEKLEKILSKEQMEEWKKIREEWRKELRERAGKKGTGSCAGEAGTGWGESFDKLDVSLKAM